MVDRQKILMGCVAGVVGLYGFVRLTHVLLIEPRRAQIAALEHEQSRRATLENLLATIPAAEGRWYEQTRRTLSADPDQAHNEFYNDIARMTNEVGLHKDLRLGKRTAIRFRDRQRRGFVELPLAISVKGQLESLVRFMRALHELPYHARVSNISVSPVQAGAARNERGRGRRSEQESVELSITMVVSTLTLPKLPGVQHPVHDPHDPEPAPSRPLLADVEPDEYEKIAAVNIFQLYVPPPPPPDPPVERPPVARTEDPPRQPPPDPRKGTENLYLRGTVSLHGEPIAYVVDETRLTEEPRRFRLNDRIDDGRLVLIHPSGIVVQSPTSPDGLALADAGDRQFLYFYAFRKSFREREPIDVDEPTEIARILRDVLRDE